MESEAGKEERRHEGLPDLARVQELLRLHRLGDPRAANELLRLHAAPLLEVIRARIGTLARFCEPEDVLQETFLVALDHLAQLRVQSPFGLLAYLTRLADNQMRRLRRYHDAKKRDPRRETHGVGIEGMSDPVGEAPARSLARTEEEERVGRLVAELSPREFREVLRLREFEGASWEEIQGRLGRPSVGAVRELHRRAVEKLARRLVPEGGSPEGA